MRQNGSEFVATISKFFSFIGPTGQWLYLIAIILVFYLMILSILLSVTKKDAISVGTRFKLIGILTSSWAYSILIFVFVLLARLPTAVYGFQNPDECLWIACAKALIREPRLWVSCDTSTSGPLVVMPLVLLNFIGLPIDVGSAKLASTLILGCSCVFAFLALNIFLGRVLSKVMVLPLVITFGLAMTFFWDYFVYNGEQVPVLLISISLFLVTKVLYDEKVKLHTIVLLGISLGLVPFAKLQGVPIAFLVAIFSLIIVFWRSSLHNTLFLVVSGLIPTIIFVAIIWAGGGLSYFWDSYITANMAYANEEIPSGASWWNKLTFAWDLILGTGEGKGSREVRLFYDLSMGLSIVSIVFIRYRRITIDTKLLGLSFFSILLFIVSLLSVGQTYRGYLHYTYFIFLPALFAMTTLSKLFLKSNFHHSNYSTKILMLMVVLLVSFSVYYFHQSFTFDPAYRHYVEGTKYGSVIEPDVVKAINENSKPGDLLTIWGWSSTFYSDTDLTMGTRFADTSGIVRVNASQHFFLKYFLIDLQRNQPQIFLDAICPRAFRYSDRKQYGFNLFPELNNFINSNYAFVGEINGFRIYKHN